MGIKCTKPLSHQFSHTDYHLINMHGTQMEKFITNEILYNGPHRSPEKQLKLLIEWGFTPYQQYFSHITTHLREAMIIP